MLALALGCGSSGATPFEVELEGFVEAWGESVALCDAQAVCGAGLPDPCAVAQLPSEQIALGVHHAHLDIQAMRRCEASAGKLGACFATLDCTTLPEADVHCAPEKERYAIDCAALLAALDYLAGEGSGGASTGGAGGSGGSESGSGGAVLPSGGAATGGGSSGGASGGQGAGGRPSGGAPGSGGSATGGNGSGGAGSGGAGGIQGVLATALCERAEACTGFRWPAEDRVACEEEATALFGPIIPDPLGTEACIDAAPCIELSSDLAALVVECIDYDPAASECSGSSTLSTCTFGGVCSDHLCRDVCSSEGLLTLGCGSGGPAAGDECLCGG